LPRANVASFKSQLLQVTQPDLAGTKSATALGDVPRPVTATGVGPGILAGGAGTNLVVVGEPDRQGAPTEPKEATVVLEIRVVPQTD